MDHDEPMRRLFLILTMLILALPAGSALACPNCRESVGTPSQPEALGFRVPEQGRSSDDQAPVRSTLSDGFNASIWLMLGGVGLSLGLIGTVVTRIVRTAPRETDSRTG